MPDDATTRGATQAPTLIQNATNYRLLNCLFYAAGALTGLLTLALVIQGWREGVALTPTSGTWIALAVDLKHGMFYRPMYGDLGYGGTRYLPLHFVLHALLMKLGLGPVAAGHALEGIAGVGLLFGMYRILRKQGAGVWAAACLAVAALVPKASQIAILSIRGDLLPTALVVLGLASCMSASLSRWRLLTGSLLFALAFAAKPTSLYGAAAVVLSLALSRKVGQALFLLMATGVGCAAVVGVTAFASGGRFIEVLRACATTAGYNLPAGLWRFVNMPAKGMPVDFVFLILGFAGFLLLALKKLTSLPVVFFACAAVSTAIVMGADGTTLNHFLDAGVASVLVFAAWLFDSETKEREFGVAALVCVIAFASCSTVYSIRHTQEGGNYFDFGYSDSMREAVAFLGKMDKPILASHPLVPILESQQPYMLDVWMFRQVSDQNPGYEQHLSDAIRQRQFGAIVLEEDLGSYNLPYFLPAKETEDVRQYYVLAKKLPRAYIFLPKGAEGGSAAVDGKSAGVK
jgi:hypothetical protein